MDNENPYASPVMSGKGEYDWSVWKNAMFTVAMLAILYLSISAVGWYRVYSSSQLQAQKPYVHSLMDFIKSEVQHIKHPRSKT